MGLKVCLTEGCFQPTTGTRCPEHEREWQRARGARRGKGRWANAGFRRVPIPPGAECACCGETSDLTRHHVIPYSWPAPHPPLPDWCSGFTLIALCRRCNSSVADRLMITRQCPLHGGEARGAGEKFG